MFPSAKIAGSRAVMQAFVESKRQSTSNITVCIKPSTTENLHGAARPMTKSTYLDFK